MASKNITRGFGILEKFLSIQRMKIALNLIKKYRKNGRILDVGCGSYPLFLVNSNFDEKFGIDQEISEIEINQYNLCLKNHNICEDLKFPFEENFFDVITMLAFVEHVNYEQLEPILKECYSLLKKNGIIIITTPSVWSNIPLKIMSKLKLVSPEEIEDHKETLTLQELNKTILKANFKQSNIQKGYFELFLNQWICAKK